MKVFITIVFVVLFNVSWSQTNVDSIFKVAIQQSQANAYSQSVATALDAFNADTSRIDIAVFIANVYAWKAQYDSSKMYIQYSFKRSAKYEELYDSWLNVLLWNKEYDVLLKIADTAQQHDYQNKYNLLHKRLLACKELKDCSRAEQLFESSDNKVYADSPAIRSLHNEIIGVCKQNAISAYYSANVFDGNNPPIQHFAYVDFSHKYKKSTFIPRLHFAYRNGQNDMLAECDYYRISGQGYWYSNLGVGFKRRIFPYYRLGLEYYHSFNQFDASLGGRFLRYATGNTYILTGHLGKTYKNYWGAVRPFIILNDFGTAFSSVFTFRKYGKQPLAYWELEFLYGNTPSERYALDTSGHYFMLNSFGVKFGRNWQLNSTDELKCMLGWVKEEFIVDIYRNRYVFEILYRHKL